MLVDINVPSLVFATDYHEFREMNDMFKKLNPKFTCSEIGFTEKTGKYVGMVYFDNMPTQNEISDMLSAQKVKLS